MPIFEHKCIKCENIVEGYYKTHMVSIEVNCPVCFSICKKIISKINYSESIGKKLSGVDDMDGELTLGKIIANKGMPAEHKRQYAEERKRRSKIAEYEKGLKERAKTYGFDPEEA